MRGRAAEAQAWESGDRAGQGQEEGMGRCERREREGGDGLANHLRRSNAGRSFTSVSSARLRLGQDNPS
eukprot:6208876-Pleurochrysis_carterae.AAC.2